jgi:putative ABC transport system substrate-binding protein
VVAINRNSWSRSAGARSLSGKWAELLKEVAPGTKRVGVLRDPANPAGIGQWAIIQAAAAARGMEVTPLAVVNPGEIERGIAGFAHDSDGGLVVPVSAGAQAPHGIDCPRFTAIATSSSPAG